MGEFLRVFGPGLYTQGTNFVSCNTHQHIYQPSQLRRVRVVGTTTEDVLSILEVVYMSVRGQIMLPQ